MLTDDTGNIFKLLYHFLVMAPTLRGISWFNCLWYLGVDPHQSLLIGWQLKYVVIGHEEVDVPSLFDHIPGIFWVAPLWSRHSILFSPICCIFFIYFNLFVFIFKGRRGSWLLLGRVDYVDEEIHLPRDENKNYRLAIDVLDKCQVELRKLSRKIPLYCLKFESKTPRFPYLYVVLFCNFLTNFLSTPWTIRILHHQYRPKHAQKHNPNNFLLM